MAQVFWFHPCAMRVSGRLARPTFFGCDKQLVWAAALQGTQLPTCCAAQKQRCRHADVGDAAAPPHRDARDLAPSPIVR
eukprot:3530580-Alexandrium_andersonii.AAC.1